jgi:CRISPR/Cas system-associated exonuclease Cas4 (RecB family)
MNYWKQRTKPYVPGQKELFKISRSKIELFKQCPRCFWLDARLKVKRPSGPPFQINKAIDELYKKEFDEFREKKKPHPIMTNNGLKALPYQHEKMDEWRNNFTGVAYLHKPTNLHIFGAVDDVWMEDDTAKLIVVDYKATSKNAEITIDADWQISYKRQMEIYQWLLRQNGFEVSDDGYFVYANARMDVDAFGDRLEFVTKLIKYVGDDSWVEKTIFDIKDCLDGDLPEVGTAAMGGECDFCSYAKARTQMTIDALNGSKR